MNVYLDPLGLHSRAMLRISGALSRNLPLGWREVKSHHRADLVILYVIGTDAMSWVTKNLDSDQRYGVVQCCFQSTQDPRPSSWHHFWNQAAGVWSYYDLPVLPECRFLRAPLGLDKAFIGPDSVTDTFRDTHTIVTSGYVSAPCAEAIEEVWTAINMVNGCSAVHIGPSNVEGMVKPTSWESMEGVSDATLAAIYRNSTYVSGLRHVEGFELPAAEGLSCGARPILFDHPTNRHWYDDKALYVPECAGHELVDRLVEIFKSPAPRDERLARSCDREWARDRFDWTVVCSDFFATLKRGL